MGNNLRLKYDSWIKSLSRLEINYLEREYIKTNGVDAVDYKCFDAWLFDEWGKTK